MGGRALHLCNPGSEVGADGAGEPSTGLVSLVAYISHSFAIVGCDSLVLILTLVLGAEAKQWPVFMVVCQEQGDR